KPTVPATASTARRPRVAPRARRSRVRRENPVVTLARLARSTADVNGFIPVLSRASGSDGGVELHTSSLRSRRGAVGDGARHPEQPYRPADEDPNDAERDGLEHDGRIGPLGTHQGGEGIEDANDCDDPQHGDDAGYRPPGDRRCEPDRSEEGEQRGRPTTDRRDEKADSCDRCGVAAPAAHPTHTREAE